MLIVVSRLTEVRVNLPNEGASDLGNEDDQILYGDYHKVWAHQIK